jgi:(3R)-3-hydroxyacyl-CoA dehydrogenase / 3a,7a,12a-trihydroxy-5b-cholest-24-enoyl-CoA hydratase / enoyl-CoA hydratase 2
LGNATIKIYQWTEYLDQTYLATGALQGAVSEAFDLMSAIGFDGRVVLITGGGNGLGRAYAKAFAARGAKVLVNDLGGLAGGAGRDPAVAQSVVDEIRAAGGEAAANGDSVEDGARIVQSALDHFGRIDVVINNAGILRDAAFHKMSEEDWLAIWRVHLNGAFQVTRAAWPHLRTQGYGRIVMTASGAGVYGNFGQANYSAAKLGLFGLAQTLAIEGRARNILVNTIAPVAASRLTQSVLPKEALAVIKPELVVPLVLLLGSDACSSTGQLLEVGGGCIARLRWERSSPMVFPPGEGFTPEQVAAQWQTIQSFSGADHPATVADSFGLIGRHAGVNIELGPR